MIIFLSFIVNFFKSSYKVRAENRIFNHLMIVILISQFTEFYLDYYQITESEFSEVIDKWANKDLFIKKNKGWVLKEEIS